MDIDTAGREKPARSGACRPAGAHRGLFVVERRLPATDEAGPAMLHAALTETTRRAAARGEPVRYLRSAIIPRQQRLLSLFEAGNADIVRAVNEAALVPFVSIEPVFYVADLGEPAGCCSPGCQRTV